MFGNRIRIRGGRLASGGRLLLAGLLACALAAPGSAEETAGSAALSEVKVGSDGEATVVRLLGPKAPGYTARQESEPARLVVELEDVAPGKVDSPIAVYDGTVEEIGVAAGERSGTTVELGLAGEVGYEVTPSEAGLELRIAPKAKRSAGGEPAEASASDDPWARAEGSGASEGAADASAKAEPKAETQESAASSATAEAADEASSPASEAQAASKPDGVASALLGVRVPEEGEARVELETDGRVASMSRFVLQEPPRLVVDLPGLTQKVEDSTVEVGRSGIARVRIGQHPQKVRVVVDAAGEGASFGDASLVRTEGGVRVALGGGGGAGSAAARTADAADASASASEGSEAGDATSAAERAARLESNQSGPASEPAASGRTVKTASAKTESAATASADAESADAASPEAESAKGDAAADAAASKEAGGPGTVFGVQFDGQAKRDRVAILTEGQPSYRVTEIDSETLVVRLLDAKIDPDASVRVAPDGPGPVSLVTAFQQPDSATPEVRVVIRRAEDLEPEIERKGGFLFVDFPSGEKLASAVPALEEPGAGEGSSAEASEAASGAADEEGSGAGEATPAASGGGGSESASGSASSTASAKAAAQTSEQAAPAAPSQVQQVESPIDVLQEGGLVDGKEYSGRRISLDFKDVEIDNVLRLIAEVSGLNIIAGDAVEGTVTIRLVDVPWDQALDVILLTKELGFTRVGNVLRIAPAEVLQKEKEARLKEKRAQEKLEDLVVKLQPVNYADADEVSDLVQRLLSSRGSVDVDERTNTVILKDIPSVIDEATALIKAVDTQTPQVVIEARIVEATLDFSRSLGSSLSFGLQRSDQELGEDVRFPTTAPVSNNLDFSNLANVNNATLGLGTLLLDDRFGLNVTLEAAETNEEIKIVSSPRVATLDNQTATIEAGQEIPFQSGISDGGATQLQFEEAKTRLEVTPHITPDKSIVMDVIVEKSSISESVESSTGDPAIDTNEAEARTLVKDGQTLVIGGLQSTTNQENESRVPLLHHIPLLGNAFKSSEVIDNRNELLIFVTPRIVQDPNVGS